MKFLLSVYPRVYDRYYTIVSSYASLANMCKVSLVNLENKTSLTTSKYYADLNLLSLKILENQATLFSRRIIKNTGQRKEI